MKLTETTLRRLIKEVYDEMSQEEAPQQEDLLQMAIDIATSLQTHLATDEIGNSKLGELVGILHELQEKEL